MQIFEAIIIATVEGITEFLPVSSTGHMIVVHEMLGFSESSVQQSFEIIVQFAAILAVLMYYRGRLVANRKQTRDLGVNVLIASVPFLAVGYLFADFWQSLFNPVVVAWMFIIGGIVFIVTEYYYQLNSRKPLSHALDQNDSENDSQKERGSEFANPAAVPYVLPYEITRKQAFIIGLWQIFSLIPGTSRAGATIVGGLWLGIARQQVTAFSFLLAVPVIGAVTAYQVVDDFAALAAAPLYPLLAGFIVSFLVAYASIALLVKFIGTHSFVVFGYYRIVFGAILLMFVL